MAGAIVSVPLIAFFARMVRPERIELPTSWFVAKHSIQLSYGRIVAKLRH